MDQYTKMLDDDAATLSPDDENYEEKLIQLARSFRTFGEALTNFLCENGYEGAADDTDAKLAFIKGKCKSSKVPVPRNIDEWFNSGTTVKRVSAFQICFAFGMNVEQTNEFFKKVLFERSFDCHTIREGVYYYCIRNGLSFKEAKAIIARIPKQIFDKKDVDEKENRTEKDVLFTGRIVDIINSAKSADELVDFIVDNFDKFRYNNATARKHIRKIWGEIARDEGLAYKEGILMDRSSNQYHLASESSDDDFVTAPEKNATTWIIYAQILGLDRNQMDRFKTNRSIKPLLENNRLLPSLAEASFPDRDGIEKITNGIHVSHERVRKLLILVVFYSFWAERIVAGKNPHFQTGKNDAERCVDRINSYLLDCGYPSLYAGNPYDWIFMWVVNDDTNPIAAFRAYMQSVFAEKSDMV